MTKENVIFNMAAFVQVPGRQKARLGDAIKMWDGLIEVDFNPSKGGWYVLLPDSRGIQHPFAVTELVYEATRLVLATRRWQEYMRFHPEAIEAMR